MNLCNLGETPFLEILSYLDAREISVAQSLCRELRQNSKMAWVQLEKTLRNEAAVATTTGEE